MRYLATESVPVDALAPYPGNARVHDEAALDESAATNGQYRSVVARRLDDGLQLLAGHGTVNAFRRQGATEVRVEVIEADDTEARRIVLADNGTSRDASYDDGLLVQLLEAAEHDGGLVGTGWDAEEYQRLLDAIGSGGSGHGDPDDVDLEPPAVPVSAPGDLWLLGPHRVLCGDSTSAADLGRLTDGNFMDMVWTDPPYGVAYQSNESVASLKARNRRTDGLTVVNDSMTEESTEQLWRAAAGAAARFCRPGASWYVAAPPGPLHHLFAGVLKDMGIWHQTLNWVKNVLVMGRSDYHYRHEPIFYGWTPGAAHYFVDDRKQDTVWEIDRPSKSADHPTMKPVELVARAIRNSSKPRQTILDPFGGSGTTLIAATQEGRVARLCEIDPAYCDVICRRYQEFTGNKPVLESTGEPHDFTKGVADDRSEGHPAVAAVPA